MKNGRTTADGEQRLFVVLIRGVMSLAAQISGDAKWVWQLVFAACGSRRRGRHGIIHTGHARHGPLQACALAGGRTVLVGGADRLVPGIGDATVPKAAAGRGTDAVAAGLSGRGPGMGVFDRANTTVNNTSGRLV